MKLFLRCFLIVSIVALAVPTTGMAAPPADRGNGYGGGGGISDEGILYGDLYVVLRDGNGEPELDDHGCVRPVYLDEGGLCQTVDMWDPVEMECGVPEDALELVVGVETGRLSVSRTTDEVLDSAYAEAAKNVENANYIDLDPAFRLRLTFYDIDDEGVQIEGSEVVKTIDSPLENLAMYKKLMLNGNFPPITVDPMGDGETVTYDPCTFNPAFSGPFAWLCDDTLDTQDLETAVSFVAAGADKGGQITLDMLVNINANLGINVLNSDLDPPTITYFDLTPFGTTYQTHVRYGQVPHVELLSEPVFEGEEVWFQVQMRSVPGNAPFVESLSCKGTGVPPSGPGVERPADFFTQAADDARAVIEFLHNWSVPEY